MTIRQKHKRLYTIWKGMRQRINNPSDPIYRWYGGRHIRICPEWDSFELFAAWALTHGYADNLTLDRIDCDGDYEPDNCRWITRTDQSRNTRRNKRYLVDGIIMTHNEAARHIGISPSTLTQRIRRRGEAWSLSTPKLPHKMTQELAEKEKQTGKV